MFRCKGPLVRLDEAQYPLPPRRRSFAEDFIRFFTRGLAALLPTLITLWLLTCVWNFLWDYLGSYIIILIKYTWPTLAPRMIVSSRQGLYVGQYLDVVNYPIRTKIVGVALAVLLVYLVGLFVGRFIGRTASRLAERAVMAVPFVRAIYPAVKQVTDFLLEERSPRLQGSRVVAIQPHEQGIWSIGMVTGKARWPLHGPQTDDMVTVFVPSTPTAFTGYVLLVPRSRVVELPMTVEEALRLLVSGGVIIPPTTANTGPIVAETPHGAIAQPG
ncbi:MAG TPA: DUF502 domain-containing protein [Tepidisphaeraceae bacterium]|nr:DUF502 domain-containing protein [Tepidisphaeraceae bacterium]